MVDGCAPGEEGEVFAWAEDFGSAEGEGIIVCGDLLNCDDEVSD